MFIILKRLPAGIWSITVPFFEGAHLQNSFVVAFHDYSVFRAVLFR